MNGARSTLSLALVVASVFPACSAGEPTGASGGSGGSGANASGASGTSEAGGGGEQNAGAGGGSGANGGSRSNGGSSAGGSGPTPSGGAGGASAGDGGGTGTGGSAAGGTPSACPASDAGNVASGTDVFVPNTGLKAVTALTYTNVGATGQYAQVVSGWSKATGCVGDTDGTLCRTVYRQPKQVSGALAPFNEEMTMVFAGPLELYQVAVYGAAGGGWERQSYWDRCVTEGLAFAGNKHWYECAGFVESYVTADGTAQSDVPVQFSGSIAAGTEVHVMSSELCSGSTAASECGWSSGLPLHGFQGDSAGSKIFATKFRMPIGSKTPAYWILPSQVIRSSQYGCNCRGAGSDPVYKGGCGELDVAEILGGVTTSLEATTTLYSFQDITGGGSVAFNRPVEESAVFLVIFDAPSRQIGIRRLGATEFDFAATLSSSEVSALLSDVGTERALN